MSSPLSDLDPSGRLVGCPAGVATRRPRAAPADWQPSLPAYGRLADGQSRRQLQRRGGCLGAPLAPDDGHLCQIGACDIGSRRPAMVRRCTMSTDVLETHMVSYLSLREALGFQIRAEKLLLPEFVAFVHAHGNTGPIRAQLALEWACQGSAHRGASGAAQRLSIARGFLT